MVESLGKSEAKTPDGLFHTNYLRVGQSSVGGRARAGVLANCWTRFSRD